MVSGRVVATWMNCSRGVDELVAHLVKDAVHRLHDHLLVGEGGQRGRAPVDHALAAVDVAAFEKVGEHPEDGPRVRRVHGELGAAPVARGAEALELLEDLAALLPAPVPDPLDELLAAEVVAGLLLPAQLALNDRLGGDSRMVEARDPERREALQPGPPYQDVLQGVVEHVAHREDARDVGRRHHDRVRVLVRRRPSGEGAGRQPGGVPPLLDLARLVALCNLGHEGALANPLPRRQASPW
jgi:hypothetical protein